MFPVPEIEATLYQTDMCMRNVEKHLLQKKLDVLTTLFIHNARVVYGKALKHL